MQDALINKYSLRFPDELEQIYQDESFYNSLKQLRINILVVTMIYALFGILDAIITPDVKYQAWFIRYAIVIPFALVVILFSFSEHFKRFQQLTISILSIVGGGGLVALIVLTSTIAPYFHFAGLLLVFMTTYTAFKLRFLSATTVGWILIVIYEIAAIWISQASLRVFMTDNFFYISANLMGMFTCYQRELYARKEFLQARCRQVEEQRKHAEEKERLNTAVEKAVHSLRESEARFRALAETSTASTIIHRGGKFLYANPTVRDTTGYSHDELLKMEFWQLVHPDDRELVRERGRARASGKDVPGEYEFKVVTKNGDERWVSAAAGHINFEGEPAIIATLFDVTDRKRAEEEKVKILEQRILEEERHLEEKGSIMMELHDGVGGITTNINILSELAQKSDDIGFIRSTLISISELSREGISEIRSFMRSLDTDGMSWHSMAAEIRNQGTSMLEPHDITFSLDVLIDNFVEATPGSLLCVNFFKIFKETLTNIIKHARATSVLAVLSITSGKLQLTIQDNGIGMEKKNDGGRGLSNMRKRASDLGGIISFTSNGGVRMSLEIPLPQNALPDIQP
jgi:PAS domain S-box-containing protein